MAWAEIIIEFFRIVAWPVVILILAGWIYPDEIKDCLLRISRLGWREYIIELNRTAYSDSNLSLTLADARMLCDICAVGHRQRIDLTVFTVAAAGRERREIFKRAINVLIEQGLIVQSGQFYRPTTKGIDVAREYLRTVGESLRAEAKSGPAA